MVWGVVAVAAAVWVSTAWLLAQTGAPDAALRIDAIKTGLSVGAGTGGAIALVLAIRRQWLGERAQTHAEEDARERRITELYGKAADQLGSDKAPVRLAGLYALERLAQTNPDHRQTIVDVICAYLRMPYVLPAALGAESPDRAAAQEELQVRLAAQSILTEHLRPHHEVWLDLDPDVPGPTFWDGMEVDLSSAVLIDFDFSHCRALFPEFSSAQFYGDTTFSYCRTGSMSLNGAVFHGPAYFHNAVIHGGAFFDYVSFHDYVNLSQIEFAGDQARFPAAEFRGSADFLATTFGGAARFDGAVFHQEVSFRGATFGSGVWFGDWPEGARYVVSASCGEAVFHGPLDLSEVSVKDPSGPNVWPTGWRISTDGETATLERVSAPPASGSRRAARTRRRVRIDLRSRIRSLLP
ncbi:pentapeptide repeat-containing protein [Actinoallomurus sp. WRP9H-5]|nr:pentapeptide repeat-containing protein [Actinoallomurus rhizosphaericola]